MTLHVMYGVRVPANPVVRMYANILMPVGVEYYLLQTRSMHELCTHELIV